MTSDDEDDNNWDKNKKNSCWGKSLTSFMSFLQDREKRETKKYGGVERWRVEREMEGLGGEEDGACGNGDVDSNTPNNNNNKRVDLLLRVCDFDLLWGGASHLRTHLYPLCR